MRPPRSEVLLNASPEALAVTLVYTVSLLEASTERISPPVLLNVIEDKLREYDGVERKARTEFTRLASAPGSEVAR